MISVFIQYADDGEGKQIGSAYREYLTGKGFLPFLATRGSPDIIAGEENFWRRIEQKLLDSNVIVAIVTDGFESASGIKTEYYFIKEHLPNPPIIPFIKNGISTPPQLKGRWSMNFDLIDYQKLFCDLTLEVYKFAHREMNSSLFHLTKKMQLDYTIREFYGGK